MTNIRKKIKKIRFLRNLYYFYLGNKDVSLILKLKERKKMRQYYNSYKGERCFIVGNGPSLSVESLNLIKNEYAFASNRIFDMYERTEWRPTFYCSQDMEVLKDINDKLIEVCSQSKASFLRLEANKMVSNDLLDKDNINFMNLRVVIKKDGTFNFSDNCSKLIYDGFTVTYSMIQLAAYMGFKEIYLLGVDHNFPVAINENDEVVVNDSSVLWHFEGMSKSKNELNPPRLNETTMSYISAKSHCDKLHISIYNSTIGGKLEVFPRKKLEKVIL